MALPDRMVWGSVPDDYQIADFRRRLAQVVDAMKPPLPPAYKSELVGNVMEMVEGWEWWQMRWFFQYDDWEQR